MNRTRKSTALLAATACVAALAGLAGCPTTVTTTLYTPITGLTIPSETLLAGLGCGTATTQVYRYAAVISLGPDAGAGLAGLPVSGVFDCFADAQFSNLPTFDGGTTTYTISIYAWNEASFPASLGGCPYDNATSPCPGENPAALEKLVGTANWTTTCTASQVQGVSEAAVCGTLAGTTDASLGPDEGTDATASEGGEAGDGGEAGEAGDAGAEGGGGGEAGDGGLPGDGAGNEAGDLDAGAAG